MQSPFKKISTLFNDITYLRKPMFHQNSLEKELSYWQQAIQDRPSDAQAYIRRGMVNFKLAKISASIEDFDTAEKLDQRLTPYLWQRGLSYYYAEKFTEGAKQFEIDLTVNGKDVEETVWRYLCMARQSSLIEAKKSLLNVKNDPRLLMGKVYELYAENCTAEEVIATGKKEGKRGNFYSHLYLGLYYEVAEDCGRAREYIAKAVEEYPLDDYMWHLARVHQQLRGWI